MSILSNQELTELHKIASDIINTECERSFQAWQESCLKSIHVLTSVPDGLEDNLRLFINDKKHLFFRGYRERIIERVKQGFKTPIQTPVFRPTIHENFEFKTLKSVTSFKPNTSFNDYRDRLFLETYLSCGENSRLAALNLGVAKSTFHDWKQAHLELIESEKRKSV